MPLLTGEDVLNFYPSGLGTLPIAGQYLTALQALPLGGRRCEGKMLIGHSDNGDITIELAKRYLDDNRRLLQLSALRRNSMKCPFQATFVKTANSVLAAAIF
jgi:hypothetical protein